MVTNGPFEFSLNRNATFNIHDPAGLRIECRLGTLWITLYGEYKDTILVPGQCFTTTEHGLVILNALSNSCVRISMNPGHSPETKASLFGRTKRDKDFVFSLTLKKAAAADLPCAH